MVSKETRELVVKAVRASVHANEETLQMLKDFQAKLEDPATSDEELKSMYEHLYKLGVRF